MKICKVCQKNVVTYKRSTKCKTCHAEYSRNHYLKNIQKYKDKANLHRQEYILRARKYVYDYLLTHPCVDCGISDIRVLDFDHVRGVKLFNIAEAGSKVVNINKIIAEIDKCDVRCRNCHAIVTNERHNWWRQQITDNPEI